MIGTSVYLIDAWAAAGAAFIYHEQTSNYVATPLCSPSGGTDTSAGKYIDNIDRSADAGFQVLPTESYTLRYKVGFHGDSSQARVYYTTDGSNPSASKGAVNGTTQQVVASYSATFADQNQSCGIDDVLTATIPAQAGGTTVKYIVSAWGSPEKFGNGTSCQNSGCATIFQYKVLVTAPSISDVADTSTPMNTAKDVSFTVSDPDTPLDSLTFVTTSSNTALVPNANISISGSGASRTASITPVTDRVGATTITITVSDGTTTASDSFVLTVTETPSLIVTTTSDTLNNTDGLTSLREALAYAAAKAGDDTITFAIPKSDSGYDAATNKYTITLGGTQLEVNSNVQINGPTAAGVIVSGNNASRVFNIPTGLTVGIANLTVKNASCSSSSGAGLFNDGSTVTLAGMTFTGNVCVNGAGGAISSLNNGTLYLIDSTVSGNTATWAGGVNSGTGTMTIVNSTITNNTASGDIGGTINLAIAQGGGIYGSPTTNLRGSIVAGNSVVAGGVGVDLYGVFYSQDYNLIGDSAGATIGGDTGHNIVGSDPKLGPLQDNGGPTFTHALLPTSAAINTGDDAVTGAPLNLATDQRSVTRLRGPHVDIGAFEYGCVPPPSGLVGWWRGEGNANDFKGGNHGTPVSGVTYASGKVGEAFSFDGVDGHIELPNVVNSWSEGTLETWVNFKDSTPTDSGDYIFSAGGGTNLGLHKAAGNDLRFGIFNGGWQWASSGVVPTAGQWYHLAASWGPAGIKIYINGVLRGSNAYTGPSFSSTYNMIGASAISTSGADALVDEFEIFNRALSETEIQSLFSAGCAGKCGPDAVDDSLSLNEDTATSLDLLSNDTDVNGDALTITSKTDGAHGTVAIAVDGKSVTYTPEANYFGSDSFTYTIADGYGGTDSATVDLTVKEANDPPTAADDSKNTNEDTALTFPASDLLVNDSPGPLNEAGQALTVTSVGTAGNGTVSLIGGQITYTPNTNYNGSDSFTYTVTDDGTTNGAADPLTATGTVNINVASVNDPPVVSAIADQTTQLDTPTGTINFTIGDADTAVDSLLVSATSSNTTLVPEANITLGGSGTNRTILLTPATGQTGTSRITVQVSDGTTTTSTTFNLHVTEAPSLIVTTTGDTTADDGLTSLREAIAYANSKAGDDTITFNIPTSDSGFDALTKKYTITLGGTQLLIHSNVQINGPTAAGVVIDGNGASRVFYMGDNGSLITVGLSNLTIKGGKAPDGFNGSNGEHGGGIYNFHSDLTLTNCTVSNNASGNNSKGGFGGAIYNFQDTLTLINVTVSDNTTGSGTNTGGYGGGIYNQKGIVNISNSTIAHNTTDTGLHTGGDGGGIYNKSGTINLTSTIVAGNSVASGGIGPDVSGILNSQDYNLIQDTTSATFTGTTTNNITGVDPLLGPLQDNGGPTFTRALLSGSPATDKGAGNSLTTDQRGLTRTFDDLAIPNAGGGDGTDIGAFELQSQPPVAQSQTVATNEDTPITITLSATDANQDPLSFSITASPGLGGLGALGTPDCTTTLGTCTATVTYSPSANVNGTDTFKFKVNDGTADSGEATVTVNIAAINDPPVISDILNQLIAENGSTGALSFTVGDIETAAGSLTVSGLSSDTALVPNGNIVFGGSGSSRTVTVTPATNQSGTSTITITVSDGTSTASDSFLLTVTAAPTPTPTPTPSPTPTETPTPTPTPTETPTPTPTPTETPTPTPTATPTPTPTPTPMETPTPPPLGQVFVQFSSPSFQVTEGCVPATITVSLTNKMSGGTLAASSTPVTVDYAITGGTASQKSDYTYVAGTLVEYNPATDTHLIVGRLVFEPGESAETIELLINQDGFAEGPETVDFTLSNPQGAVLGSPAETTLTINDDDLVDSSINPIDEPQNFVCQQYHDFLHRQPDDAGLAFWTNQIAQCGTDANCVDWKRHNVAMAFFLSIEYQETGYYVDRLYEACLSRHPSFEEYVVDMHRVGLGVEVLVGNWQQQLEANKQSFAEQFVGRSEFLLRYPMGMPAGSFVDEMFEYAGVNPTSEERQAAIDAFGAGDIAGRAAAMRKTMESASVFRAYYNQSFVQAEYFGYLRRDANDPPDNDWSGYDFWLAKMNEHSLPTEDVTKPDDAYERVKRGEMVRAFIVSEEYRSRFGKP